MSQWAACASYEGREAMQGKVQNEKGVELKHLVLYSRKQSVNLDMLLLELRRWMGDSSVGNVFAS